MTAIARQPFVRVGLLLAPSACVVLAIFWVADGVFLLPQTLLASISAGALSRGINPENQWGFHGLIAGISAIVLSLVAFAAMVD